jgi:hypothetical protein
MKLGSSNIAAIQLGTQTVSKMYLGSTEVYSSAPAFAVTGGTYTEAGGYAYHTFTTSGILSVTGSGEVEYLIVAGGGSGGTASQYMEQGAGGGGAGGYLSGTITLEEQNYSIVVGAGGSKPTIQQVGNNGANSTAFGLTAIGGGGGGSYYQLNSRYITEYGQNGGSGGGASGAGGYGQGTAPQGYRGGPQENKSGGGGGGAGGPAPDEGTARGNGGIPRQWVNGVYYAAGAPGGNGYGSSAGAGEYPPNYGGPGSGGKGGTASSTDSQYGDAGLAGTVIVRYALA